MKFKGGHKRDKKSGKITDLFGVDFVVHNLLVTFVIMESKALVIRAQFI